MNLSPEDRKLILDFNRNVSWLKSQTLKDSTKWVKSSVITGMTGWDSQQMRRARLNGSIVWKKDDKGFWYDPSSIAKEHLKKETA
jgi:hypothetical protein